MEQAIDWREQRRRILEKAKRVIVKVGSAVLTSAKGLDERVVNRLADQIAGLHDRGLEIVLVTSGAVAPLNILAELCLPYVREGGLFLPLKSKNAAAEEER